MARRPTSQVRSRRRPRDLMLEILEGRRLLAANVVVGNDAGGRDARPLVRLIDSETGVERANVLAFESTFKGGTRVAMGRVTGNASPDVVVGSGSGRVAEVRVFKSVTSGGATTLQQVLAFQPFGASYRGGIEVVVGDVDGDAIEDIIVSKSREGGDVKVYRVTNAGGTTTATPYATIAKPFGPRYNGGSSVGVADVGEFTNGAFVKSVADNKVELLVGSGSGMPAQVRVYDISRPAAPRLADSVVPFGPLFQGGVSATGGRYAATGVADSIDDIVVTAGRGGASQVRVFDGTVNATTANTLLKSFAPYASLPRPNAAVFAAAVDVDGNGQVDRFLTTQGDPGGRAGIANVSIAGVSATTPVTTLAGPMRIAGARTVFQTQTINGIVGTPSPTAGVVAGSSRPMQIREIVTGSGTVANTWDKVAVQYTGMLTDGTVFDSSRRTGRTPFEVTIGAGQVIAGWEAGLVGMKVGGRRLLVIPPELAYGNAGQGDIPPNATLVFDVELVSVTANRAATIGGTSTGALTEDGTPTSVGGTLSVSDPDNSVGPPANLQNRFRDPASLAGTYGTFTFNSTSGVWGYTIDNSRPVTQALAAGQSVTDSLTVTSRDGTASRQIVVTIAGAGEAAAISGTATGSLTAGVGSMTASGTLTVTDADPAESSFATPATASLAGTYGDFTFNAATGAWAYALDTGRPATLLLRSTSTVTDSLVVTSLDGTASRTIQVSITGFSLQTTSGETRVVSGDIPVGTVREMQYADIVVGPGATVTAGNSLQVNYMGMLADGTVFNSWRSFGPIVLGAGSVIAGWDTGLVGMKVGGQRLLVIPPELGYGDTSLPGIPAGSTLIFKVELLSAT